MSAWRELNPRPSSYKDAARTTELHAVKVRPEGFEPTPRGLKVRCATVTPQPLAWLWLCVSIEFVTALQSLSFLATQSVPSGSPEDRTQRDPVISRIWATSPRLPFVLLVASSRVCRNRTALRRPKRRVPAITLHARCCSATKWTCWELNPEALSASQSADPSASPLGDFGLWAMDFRTSSRISS